MQKSLITILITVLVIGCNSKPEIHFEFQPGKSTSLRFHIKNCTASKSFKLFYNHTLPAGQEVLDLNFYSDTITYINISLNHPLHVTLFEPGVPGFVVFFVIPDDTLYVSLNFASSNSLMEAISFEGETASISDYLTNSRYRFVSAPSRDQNPAVFDSMIDSLYGTALITLDSLGIKGALPGWFVNLERVNIKHEREYHKLQQYSQRIWFYDEFIHRGSDFYNKIDLGEMNYYWLHNTMRMLNRIRPDKYDTLLNPNNVNTEISFNYRQDNIDRLKGRLPDNVMSYFVASTISRLFSGNRLLRMSPLEFQDYRARVDNFLDANSALIKDTAIYSFLIKEKERKYNEVEDRSLLVTGDVAPNFYLADIHGNNVQLSDFKGKVVLLNFWGTFCQPCIRSIPRKNKLVEDFKNDEFILVNICTDSNHELWKQIIVNNGFKGTQLICKGNWYDILRSGYNIYGIPHYTIIDKNGLILKNNIRDSLEYYVRTNL